MKSKSAKAIGFIIAVMMFMGAASPAMAALTESQISAILALLSSFGADQAVVDNVNASLRGQATSGTTGGSSAAVCPFTWAKSLSAGDTGDDVKALQQFLNSDVDTTVAASGVGSAGSETIYFGSLTGAAVTKFQDKYASDVLTPIGLTSGTGYFGTMTMAKANELCSTASTPTTPDDGTPVVVPTGTGLTVGVTVQPLNDLAPQSASRLPFTKFTVTAGSDGAVVMDSITVERTGRSANTSIAGIVLIDEEGTQWGLAKTLNSNNQARVGAAVTIPAGTTKTFTVAANMAASLSARAGEIVSLTVVGINTSATVTGSLPITGASHTVNATLALGTVTAARGALDPNTSPTKEVGTTAYTFSAVKFTAGSAEDVMLKSIRWNQTSSVAISDIENIVIILDGVSYTPTISTDGKYYSTTFGSGVIIKEGLTKEVSIKGDIVGGSNRGVDFDLYQATDAYFVGQTFGYGITPTIGANNDSDTSSDDSEFNDGTNDGGTPPWYDGQEVTVGTGSVTVSSTNDVPASNIAEGASGVSLGSFKFNVQGEEVSFTQVVVTIATSSGSGTDGGEDLTNITLVDANGSILAGPQDPVASGLTVTFTDTITLPVGENIIIVKGTLNNDWENNDTIIVSLATAATAISSITGAVSGQTITATPAANVTAKTQTVNAASLTITPDSSFVDRNIINNSSDQVLGRYVLDASASGEDLRITTAQFEVTTSQADADDYNTIQLWDGSTALNTGSNAVNPSSNDDGDSPIITLTLDSPGFTIPKGTSKVLELRGNISDPSIDSPATAIFDFSGLTSSWTTTGLQTGTDVGETLSQTAGATLTVVSNGVLTATIATSDPVEAWYVAGTEGIIGKITFTGTNEAIAITDLSLILDTGSSSSADIRELTLWDGVTKLITKIAPFQTSNVETIDLPSSGTGAFIVPRDDNKDLIIKVKFADIGTAMAGASGKRIRIATTTTAANHRMIGKDSGTAANILGDMGTTTGAKYFRSLPTLAKLSVPLTTLANGEQELYRFSVTADPADDIAVFKFTFTVATTSADTTTFTLTEKHSGKVVANESNGITVSNDGTNVDVLVDSAPYGAAFITIPAGETYIYQLKAVVTNAGTSGDSVRIFLNGDDLAVLANGKYMDSTTDVDNQAEDDFIWSPISTGSVIVGDEDWINGYRVPGILTDNLGTEVVSN